MRASFDVHSGSVRLMRKFGVIAVVGLLAVVGVVVNGGGTTEVAEPASIEAQAEDLLDLGPIDLIANQYGQVGIGCFDVVGTATFATTFSPGSLGLTSDFATSSVVAGLSGGSGNGSISGGNLVINVQAGFGNDCSSVNSGDLVAVAVGTLVNGDSFVISFVAA